MKPLLKQRLLPKPRLKRSRRRSRLLNSKARTQRPENSPPAQRRSARSLRKQHRNRNHLRLSMALKQHSITRWRSRQSKKHPAAKNQMIAGEGQLRSHEVTRLLWAGRIVQIKYGNSSSKDTNLRSRKRAEAG